MANFIELTESKHAQKILVTLEEITFFEVSENKKGKTTILHFTSATYNIDRSVGVIENYETVKDFIIKAKLWAEGK